ncbi:hypothetical protein C0389_08615 [bacterium]|nr:hypothetical protein [bacterium]
MAEMKLLLVITKSDIGGAQVFVINLARSLRDLGYDVEVAAGEGDYLFEELKKYNVPYHFLRSLKRDFNVFNSFSFVCDLYRLIKAKKYQILHFNSSNALIGALSTVFLKPRPKNVFTFHGLSFLDKNYEMNSFFRFLSKLYFKLFLFIVDKPVFVSNTNYKESIESSIVKSGHVIYYGLDENKMEFINAKDARKFLSELCKTDLSDVFLIGSAGRLAYQKNYDFLIKNFKEIQKEIPTAKIIIIGDGPYYERFMEEIKERGIQNDFFLVGAIKNTYRYMKAFDVFTLPSHYEGLPISLIEAVLAEIPILASDVGGNKENVGNSSEQVFILNDIDDYIQKLREIKKNSLNIVESNIKLKMQFSLDNMVKNYKDIYESMLREEQNNF